MKSEGSLLYHRWMARAEQAVGEPGDEGEAEREEQAAQPGGGEYEQAPAADDVEAAPGLTGEEGHGAVVGHDEVGLGGAGEDVAIDHLAEEPHGDESDGIDHGGLTEESGQGPLAGGGGRSGTRRLLRGALWRRLGGWTRGRG